MEALRRFRRAISPESETFVLVTVCVLAILAMLYVAPYDSWPSRVLGMLACAFGGAATLSFLSPAAWPTWRTQPIHTGLNFAAAGLFSVGFGIEVWNDFTGGPDGAGQRIAVVGLALHVVSRLPMFSRRSETNAD